MALARYTVIIIIIYRGDQKYMLQRYWKYYPKRYEIVIPAVFATHDSDHSVCCTLQYIRTTLDY